MLLRFDLLRDLDRLARETVGIGRSPDSSGALPNR